MREDTWEDIDPIELIEKQREADSYTMSPQQLREQEEFGRPSLREEYNRALLNRYYRDICPRC